MAKFIITGGGWNNKGAESMLYTLISNIRTKMPDSDISVIIFNDSDQNIDISLLHNIKIIRTELSCLYDLLALTPFKLFNYKFKHKFPPHIKDLYSEFTSCKAVFDVSGFALSSKRPDRANLLFLSIINLAKKFNKKIVLFPQSFGPFDYSDNSSLNISFIKKVLSNVDWIFCREKDGFNYLDQLGLKNISISPDLVLQNSKPYFSIFNKKSPPPDITIKNNSVLIMPSIRVFERSIEKNFFSLYVNMINFLLDKNYYVYLSFYDIGDFSLCQKIKSFFPDNDNVIFLDENFNCIQFSEILPAFHFLITSRFHSVVHAYKLAIPCIVIGWAVKYIELTNTLNQSHLLFNGIDNYSINDFISRIDSLLNNSKNESQIIKNNLIQIQKNNCFDFAWKRLSFDYN